MSDSSADTTASDRHGMDVREATLVPVDQLGPFAKAFLVAYLSFFASIVTLVVYGALVPGMGNFTFSNTPLLSSWILSSWFATWFVPLSYSVLSFGRAVRMDGTGSRPRSLNPIRHLAYLVRLVLGHIEEDEYDARIQWAIAALVPVGIMLAPAVSLVLR